MDRGEIERQLTEPGTGARPRRVPPARKHRRPAHGHGATCTAWCTCWPRSSRWT